MKPPLPPFCALAAFLCGCAHPGARDAALSSDPRAADEARREERLKIMREVWAVQTGADGAEVNAGRQRPPALEYPAGRYSGINFGPRLAPDPSLVEPER